MRKPGVDQRAQTRNDQVQGSLEVLGPLRMHDAHDDGGGLRRATSSTEAFSKRFENSSRGRGRKWVDKNRNANDENDVASGDWIVPRILERY